MKKDERRIIADWAGKRVLVVGDVMLDEYIWGEVERISPEAPVPVVRVKGRSWTAGGAANVAHNVAALGGSVELVGLIGRDQQGKLLKRVMERAGIGTGGLIVSSSRPTVTKSRILAGHQQVVRIDTEQPGRIAAPERREAIMRAKALAGSVDAVIIEDYSKGLLDQEMIDRLIGLSLARDCPVVADPNENQRYRYRGATLVTPNRKEALVVSGLPRETPTAELGRHLLRRWGPRALLITLGEDGMCLFERRKKPFFIPTVAREVFDVSGAGDTVVGTLALALAAGADFSSAAELANRAAGIVVGKLGTATASASELLEAVAER